MVMSESEPGASPREEEARPLIEEGLREASGIPHPIARLRHRSAWAYRLSRLDPVAAGPMLDELPEDEPFSRLQFLLALLQDRIHRGDSLLEPHATQAIDALHALEPEAGVRALNSISEAALELGDRDKEAAIALLRRLVPEIPPAKNEERDLTQPRALGCALLGEALLILGDGDGLTLLHEAEELVREMPGRDPIVVFLATAITEREPERAVALLETVENPAVRLEARLTAAEKLTDRELRGRVFDQAEADAAFIEHMRGPEALVRMGQALAVLEPERARGFFERALARSGDSEAQLRSLQWTGVASALAPADREWAATVFKSAVAAAEEEGDPVRRATALVVIADEMSGSFPREAAEVFQRGLDSAVGLQSMWEYAHLLDVIFRQDRSPYLDVSPATGLLDEVLARLSEDDPRIPGVFGLPEAAQLLLQVDTEKAVPVLHRWFSTAKAAGDSDAMIQAALTMGRVDPEARTTALTAVRDLLLSRIDCPAMGEFSRAVAPVAPDLVLSLANQIPDRRERTDALTSAAVYLYDQDAERALALIRDLERPVDRSLALLLLVDRLLGTGDRPQPQPLLEDLP